MMHFQGIDAAIAAGDPDLLTDAPNAACVKGCYRCLLSYYNQPDHEHIDRTDDAAKRLLVALGASTVEAGPKRAASGKTGAGGGGRSAEPGPMEAALAAAGVPHPDERPLSLGGMQIPFVWRSHRVAATCEALTAEAQDEAKAKGFDLFQLPAEPAMELPAKFLASFG